MAHLHVSGFDKPRLVSQHLVDGEEVDHLGGDVLEPFQPLRVSIVLQELRLEYSHLHITQQRSRYESAIYHCHT